MKTFLAFLFTVGLIAGAGHFAMEKGYVVNPFEKIDLNRAEIVDEIVSETNRLRENSMRTTLVADADLDTWLAEQAKNVTPHESSVDVLLNRLETMEPSVSSASAQFISANKAEEVTRTLQEWAEQLPDGTSDVAVHLFPKSPIQPFRAVAVAAERLPKFSPRLLGVENDGLHQRFYNICATCKKPHVSMVTRESLAVALECPTCEAPYDLYAMKLDGSYCRVTDLLTGYERSSGFPDDMSKYDQMLAIWRTVLKEFVYTTDLQGSNGPQDSWQTAAQTSKIGNGDCEDTSIFMTDWLISRGINARVAIGVHSAGGGHAWCVAEVDGKEYLLETTGGNDTDTSKPPLVSRSGNEYQPLAMFDNHAIYFRENEDPIAQYFTSAGWNQIECERSEILPTEIHRPRLKNMALSADLFGMDRVPERDGE